MTPAMKCSHRAIAGIQSMASLRKNALDDEIEDGGEEHPADDRSPKRIERIFHDLLSRATCRGPGSLKLCVIPSVAEIVAGLYRGSSFIGLASTATKNH